MVMVKIHDLCENTRLLVYVCWTFLSSFQSMKYLGCVFYFSFGELTSVHIYSILSLQDFLFRKGNFRLRFSPVPHTVIKLGLKSRFEFGVKSGFSASSLFKSSLSSALKMPKQAQITLVSVCHGPSELTFQGNTTSSQTAFACSQFSRWDSAMIELGKISFK